MQDANYLANKVTEYVGNRFSCDSDQKLEVLKDVLAILQEGETGKPVGAATIVETDAVEQFPPHDENITS